MSVITLSVNDTARGVVSGGGTYDDGTQITVSATNTSGYLFSHWSDGSKIVSANETYTFTVSGDLTLTAWFYNEVDTVQIYGFDRGNNRHRVMNIGQVISLIQEMASNGWQVPENFVACTSVQEIVDQNTGATVKFFFGTQAEWKAWTGDKTYVFFVDTDNTESDELNATLTDIQEDIKSLKTADTNHETALETAELKITALESRCTELEAELETCRNFITVDQTLSVNATTGTVSSLVGETELYSGSGTATILANTSTKTITDLSITDISNFGNKVNYDSSTGVLSYTLYSTTASTKVTAFISYKITLKQYVENSGV